MIAWLVEHWVGASIGALVLAYAIWWIAKPPSWRDGEGDNADLVDVGSFKQFH
jgi:hypothetical protein